MLAGRQLLVLYIISSLCSCQHAGADGADLVQIRLQHDRETNSTKKYVFMGAGIANNGYTGNKWLGLYNLGVQGCYDAIMADTKCNKDYFTYSARYDLNCGCKITSGRLIVDSNEQFDYYRVQTPLAKTPAHLKCPAAWTQVGPPNADVAGCGLEACGQRYGKKTITECATFCARNKNCASFTWAPIKGDRNHMNSPVCTMYKVDKHTGIWSPKQIMCKKPTLTWYTKPGDTSTYKSDASFCANKGGRLATYAEYCPGGEGADPYDGKKDGDQWAAFSGAGENEWVEVGHGSAPSWHPACKKHTPSYGKPSWGTDTNKMSYETYTLCALP